MTDENLLQKDLNDLRDKIVDSGYNIIAQWADEYGGLQSIKLTYMDKLIVVKEDF